MQAVFPWRQGTPCGDVIASVKFSQPERLLFIVRSKAGLHPRVVDAYREDGQRLTSCQERDCQAIISPFPQRQRAELEAEWRIEGEPFRARLIVSWNPPTQCFDALLPHLPQDRETIRMICLGEQRRWQVELLCTAGKSSTNFHKFATDKATISAA
jgi:hypothetical protein